MFWLIDFVIIRPIVNILFVIYNFVGDFGLAIILFTILVKFLMWPLVKRQLHQTKLMRKIQPELAEIKKNCKGNRQMESLQMMDLYKRHNIKPFRTVVTTLIQLPIFLALFMSISAMVNPRPSADTCGYTNVANCAYEPVRNLDRVKDIIEKQDHYFEAQTAAKAAEEAGEEYTAPTYEFEPKLFGVIDLSVTPSDVFHGKANLSSVVVLLFAVGAAIMQYFVAKQTNPSGKSKKSKSFRQLLREAANGDKEPDQSEINAMASKQMTSFMPIMMFFIMFALPGALVFYYLLSSGVSVVQQRIALKQAEDEMEVSADKAVLKELRKIQEAEVIENKKTGTKITRISAKDTKKKRRK
ncbi:membrane protein insertase YidC [Candidatus Saccharibacteria bacterium]|nr:membrane protein insertase YidC [Candidatus Saccharibacteria bacterium]